MPGGRRLPKRSPHAFPAAFEAAKAARGYSYRDLERITERLGRKLTGGYIHHLVSGLKRPTVDNLETLARALDVDAEYFREMREHMAAERARELTRDIGLDEVLAALRRIERRGKP